MASIQETGRGRRPYRVRWRENGRLRSQSFATLAEAERHKAKIEGRQAAAVAELKPNLSFERFAGLWLIYQRTELGNAPATIERARKDLDYVILPWAKRERWTVANVTPGQLRALMKARRAEVAPETAAKTAGILMAMFRDARAMGFRLDDPTEGLRARVGRGHRKRSTIDIPSTERVTDVLERLAPKPRVQALVATIAYTGGRPSEVLGLRWSADIDRERRLIRLGDVPMVEVRGVMVAKEGAKTRAGTGRTVPMLRQLEPYLDAAEQWRDERMDLVFPGRWTKAAAAVGGRSMSLDHARKLLNSMVPDAPDPYDLRHFYASTMIAATRAQGMNSAAIAFRIKNAMGHAKISETYDTYGHLLDPEVDDLGAALEAALDAAG